jgi:RNA polymerase sigma-70 factor (sigma-E family)
VRAVPRDFGEYVAASSGRLLRLSWLLTGDVHDAEDLVQTALGRAFQHWDRAVRSDDLDAYVKRILLNAQHSRFRRRRVVQVPLDLAARRPTIDGAMSSVTDRSGLVIALRALPLRQRQVVVLRYLDDRSERDTAILLGCSVGTVKSAASRGLGALRAHPALGADPGHDPDPYPDPVPTTIRRIRPEVTHPIAGDER